MGEAESFGSRIPGDDQLDEIDIRRACPRNIHLPGLAHEIRGRCFKVRMQVHAENPELIVMGRGLPQAQWNDAVKEITVQASRGEPLQERAMLLSVMADAKRRIVLRAPSLSVRRPPGVKKGSAFLPHVHTIGRRLPVPSPAC